MKLREWLVGSLGAACAGVILCAFLVLATKKSEVDELMEILTADDAADAAWAVERLQEIPDEALVELLPHLDNTKLTPVRHLDWIGPRFSGGTCRESTRVFELAQWVFSTHIEGNIQIEESTQGLREKWEGSMRMHRTGASLLRTISRLFRDPRLLPPSRDLKLSMMARDGSTGELLRVLKESSRPEAAWALEELKGLTPEKLDSLVPLLSAAEVTSVRSLHFTHKNGSGGMSFPKGAPLGQVIRYLLLIRMGKYDSVLRAHRANPLMEGELEELKAAWKEWRRA